MSRNEERMGVPDLHEGNGPAPTQHLPHRWIGQFLRKWSVAIERSKLSRSPSFAALAARFVL